MNLREVTTQMIRPASKLMEEVSVMKELLEEEVSIMKELLEAMAAFEEKVSILRSNRSRFYESDFTTTVLTDDIKNSLKQSTKQIKFSLAYDDMYPRTGKSGSEREGIMQAPIYRGIRQPFTAEKSRAQGSKKKVVHSDEPWQLRRLNLSGGLFKHGSEPVQHKSSMANLLSYLKRSTKTSPRYSSATRDHSNRNYRTNMQKASSWITVMTFPGCLLLSNYRHYSSVCNEQTSLSIWLALLGMLNFTAFLSSLFLMAIYGAHFTPLQITLLLISAILIIMNAYVPTLSGSFTHG